MRLKFNWGTGIAATYILFIVGVLIMVVIFMNQDVSLETKDYYVKGIKYQDEIDKINRTKKLPAQLEIKIEPGSVVLFFPKIFKPNEFSGKINFIRPSDKSKDFTIAISPDSMCNQIVSTANFTKGLWKIRIDWNGKGISYFNEKIMMIN